MSNKVRIQILDVFRGFAALEVILFHYTKHYQMTTGQNDNYFEFGNFGVMFFFMISGYVIFFSLQKVTSFKIFLSNRFSRLYPAFWVCLIFTLLVVYIFGLPGREISFRDALINITMVPKIFGSKLADGVYWSLLPELFFYFLMTFVLYFNLKKRIFTWIVPWVILCAINALFKIFPPPISVLLNLNYGVYFIAGIMFYKIRTDGFYLKYNLLLFFCLAISIVLNPNLIEAFILSFYFILFYLFSLKFLDKISIKPLAFIGRISYPLYLVHQNLGYIIINFLEEKLNDFYIFYLILPFLLSVTIAYIVHITVEIPIANWVRGKRVSIKSEIEKLKIN
jgi:peptidoglycan/LPS O-acetylase OafA/YrhL